MRLVHKIQEVREQIKQWKKEGLTIGFVPTMGALHAGHLSLIKKSVEKCDRTVVSIFVNPIQFGPNEDLDKYPRTLEADCETAKEADLIFAPTPAEMYGEGFRLSNDYLTYVIPPYFYMDKLCGKSRIGHFDGFFSSQKFLFFRFDYLIYTSFRMIFHILTRGIFLKHFNLFSFVRICHL